MSIPTVPADNDVALAKAFKQVSCGVCHANPDNKKIRNDYGKQLEKLLSKKDKKNKAKIAAALERRCQAEEQASDPTNAHLWRQDRQRQVAGGEVRAGPRKGSP